MKFLLFLIGLLWGFGQARGQNIVFTNDSFYVASGIMAKGMAIELFELDSINNKPLLVHRIGPLERVEMIIFKNNQSLERFVNRTEREGMKTMVLTEWPDWLRYEIQNNPNVKYIDVVKRLAGNLGMEKSASPMGKHLVLAGVHLENYRKRQLQAAGLLVLTSVSVAVLWPVLIPEALGIIGALGSVGSLALWYDGLQEASKASENLQKAGKLAEDTPSF